jgi:hypothetical protein
MNSGKISFRESTEKGSSPEEGPFESKIETGRGRED